MSDQATNVKPLQIYKSVSPKRGGAADRLGIGATRHTVEGPLGTKTANMRSFWSNLEKSEEEHKVPTPETSPVPRSPLVGTGTGSIRARRNQFESPLLNSPNLQHGASDSSFVTSGAGSPTKGSPDSLRRKSSMVKKGSWNKLHGPRQFGVREEATRQRKVVTFHKTDEVVEFENETPEASPDISKLSSDNTDTEDNVPVIEPGEEIAHHHRSRPLPQLPTSMAEDDQEEDDEDEGDSESNYARVRGWSPRPGDNRRNSAEFAAGSPQKTSAVSSPDDLYETPKEISPQPQFEMENRMPLEQRLDAMLSVDDLHQDSQAQPEPSPSLPADHYLKEGLYPAASPASSVYSEDLQRGEDGEQFEKFSLPSSLARKESLLDSQRKVATEHHLHPMRYAAEPSAAQIQRTMSQKRRSIIKVLEQGSRKEIDAIQEEESRPAEAAPPDAASEEQSARAKLDLDLSPQSDFDGFETRSPDLRDELWKDRPAVADEAEPMQALQPLRVSKSPEPRAPAQPQDVRAGHGASHVRENDHNNDHDHDGRNMQRQGSDSSTGSLGKLSPDFDFVNTNVRRFSAEEVDQVYAQPESDPEDESDPHVKTEPEDHRPASALAPFKSITATPALSEVDNVSPMFNSPYPYDDFASEPAHTPAPVTVPELAPVPGQENTRRVDDVVSRTSLLEPPGPAAEVPEPPKNSDSHDVVPQEDAQESAPPSTQFSPLPDWQKTATPQLLDIDSSSPMFDGMFDKAADTPKAATDDQGNYADSAPVTVPVPVPVNVRAPLSSAKATTQPEKTPMPVAPAGDVTTAGSPDNATDSREPLRADDAVPVKQEEISQPPATAPFADSAMEADSECHRQPQPELAKQEEESLESQPEDLLKAASIEQPGEPSIPEEALTHVDTPRELDIPMSGNGFADEFSEFFNTGDSANGWNQNSDSEHAPEKRPRALPQISNFAHEERWQDATEQPETELDAERDPDELPSDEEITGPSTIRSRSNAKSKARPSITPMEVARMQKTRESAKLEVGYRHVSEEMSKVPVPLLELDDGDANGDSMFGDLEKEFEEMLRSPKRGYTVRENDAIVVARERKVSVDRRASSPIKKIVPKRKVPPVPTLDAKELERAETIKASDPSVTTNTYAQAARPRASGQSSALQGPAVGATKKAPAPLNDLPTDERGRLLIRMLSVDDINLPGIDTKGAKFSVTLDNGVHCITTPHKPLRKNASVGEEFELTVGEAGLEFILTFKAKCPKQTARKAVPPPQTVVQEKESRHGLSKLFGAKKRTASRASPAPATQPGAVADVARVDPWQNLTAADGSFGRSYIDFAQYEKDIYGKSATFEITCFNEWATNSATRTRREPYKIAKVKLQMMFVPRVSKSDTLPSSIEEAQAVLERYSQEEPAAMEGHLSQLGGDCQYWRRRFFILKDSTLIAHSDVSRKPRANINLAKAARVIADRSSLSEPVVVVGKNRRRSAFAEKEEGALNIDKGFRIRFANGEIIDFFADTNEDKDAWISALAQSVGKKGSGRPAWVDAILYGMPGTRKA